MKPKELEDAEAAAAAAQVRCSRCVLGVSRAGINNSCNQATCLYKALASQQSDKGHVQATAMVAAAVAAQVARAPANVFCTQLIIKVILPRCRPRLWPPQLWLQGRWRLRRLRRLQELPAQLQGSRRSRPMV